MKRTMPTGGVSRPIIRFSTMIRPKCTGSMPSLAMIGMNTGTRIVIAAIVSMKQPTKSRKILASSRKTSGLSLIDSTQAAIASVICVVVSTQAKIDALATMNSTVAVVSIVSIETLMSIRQFIVRYQANPRKSAHATAATAASVGVNRPLAMPPIRITGVSSAMNASNLNTLSVMVADKVFKFEAFMALLTPVILIGGMASGLFTPTEAAVAAVAWALFLGFAWYRTMNWRMLIKVSMETIETTATVLFIVASASIFAWVLTTTQITDAIAAWVLSISDNPLVFLLLANIFLLFVGCFMETIAAITILVPVFMPIIAKLGIDPVHFGLIMVLNLMIGLLTPPVGMVLFILQKVARISFERTVQAVLPWLWPLLATLALITYVPQLVLWL